LLFGVLSERVAGSPATLLVVVLAVIPLRRLLVGSLALAQVISRGRQALVLPALAPGLLVAGLVVVVRVVADPLAVGN
jgi:hypothetical protein